MLGSVLLVLGGFALAIWNSYRVAGREPQPSGHDTTGPGA